MAKPEIFRQLQSLITEQRNSKTLKIDSADIRSALRLINSEDRKVADAVRSEIPSIAKAVEFVVRSFKEGGRLIYVGAGTSGRLGILDASECPPTFGSDPSMVQGLIAGGPMAVFQSQEGSEDVESDGAREMDRKRVNSKDTVCGIAASMRTPYVLGALVKAKKKGARVILVTTNSKKILNQRSFARLRKAVDVAICANVGPEVIMGSTRMKSGTAQKLILNMISTTAMIRIGKVYENMMVDLKMNSRKLEERAKRVLMIATAADYDTASLILKESGWHVKTAIVMLNTGVSAARARKLLRSTNGFVRPAIGLRKVKEKR